MIAIIYDLSTGYIKRNVSVPSNMLELQFDETVEGAIPVNDVVDDTTFYVDLMSRIVLTRQDYTLENLPLPCKVMIEGVIYECTKQPVFEFDAPGKYTVKVNAGAAYLEKEFEIDYQP